MTEADQAGSTLSQKSSLSMLTAIRDDALPKVTRSALPSRPYDSSSIPSLTSFLSVDSDRTTGTFGLSVCHSSPILVSPLRGSLSDTDQSATTGDTDSHWTNFDADDAELNEGDDDNGLCSDSSGVLSSLNVLPHISSNDEESAESVGEFLSTGDIMSATASADVTTDVSIANERESVYSLTQSRNRHKRRISNWYQESLVKSYRAKVNHFKKIFSSTPVDTDRLLVDYSCALAKNKNGLLLLGRMYITEKWICFYSKIIYELKLFLAVEDIQSVSKAKTVRLIPNAIQLTLKSNDERYFFTSFASRERTFAILKRVCENSKAGGRILPSESEVTNMEELLCQVQDVYGDESIAILDFEEGDELEEGAYPSLPVNRSVSSSELNDSPVTHPNCQRMASSTAASPPLDRLNEHPLGRRRRRPDTDEIIHRKPCSQLRLNRQRRTNETSASQSYSFHEMSESEATANSGTSEDDVDKSQEGLTEGKHEQTQARRPSHKVRRAPLPPPRASTMPTFNTESDAPPVTCGTGHNHPGRKYADADINLSVDALFACLFTDSQFFADFCAHRGTFDVEQSRWPSRPWPTPEHGDATLHRKISYVLTLKQRVGPRTCTAVENQTIILRETRPGKRYVIDAKVTNEAVPLCNSFHVTSRYCLLRRSDTVSHLIITSEVVYDRPVFFGAKSIIESTCKSSLTDNFTDLVGQLSAAAALLSDNERISGGTLAKPHRRRLTRPQKVGFCSKSSGDKDTAVGGKLGATEADKNQLPSSSSMPSTQCGLTISQALFCPNQQSDRKWPFIIAVSLGLCVFLSMIYNRYQRLEKVVSRQFDFSGRTFDPASPCCDELTSVRLLVDSVSDVLAQMRTTLELLERRIDQMGSKPCKVSVEDAFLGN
uniref:VASt domain-containing protein n=3 Tax=Mesocestoides corti TaxID=53468 RepID=A0A5K3EPB5_MESCO